MSKGFFDFSTDLPTLGSGKAKEFSRRLLGGPDDYEIDQLNEQTFGDAAIEGDWEEQHEKLAEEIGSCRRNEFNGDDFFNTGQKYNNAQDELEHSLNQLVVDDDDLEPVHHNGQPIPSRRSAADVDSLFGPSSPPGLLNTEELVGGHQNIWGSPVRESYMPKQEDGLKNLLKVLQMPKSTPVTLPQHQDPSIVSSVKSLSTTLPNAKTLAEIEQELGSKRQGVPISIPGRPPAPTEHYKPVHNHKPVVRTLEEIEQEMTGHVQSAVRKVPSPPQPGFPFPIGTPPQAYSGGIRPKSGPVPIPGGLVTIGRGAAPPPMPSPGHPTPGSAPRSGSSGPSPHGPISILQRTTPPPLAARSTTPTMIAGAVRTPHGRSDQRTSPVFTFDQDTHRSNHGDLPGSPMNLRSNVPPPRMPLDRPVSPLDGTLFTPQPPHHPRMSVVTAHSEPTHYRGGHRGGPPPHIPGPNMKLFRGPPPDYHHVGSPDDHHNFWPPENHRGRGDFGHRGRGEFNNRGRGDFGFRGRGDFNHRGDYGGPGPHRGRGDFRDFQHRGPPRDYHDDYNHREFNGRGDYHHQRGFPPRGGPGFRGHPPPGYHHNGYNNRPRYNSYGDEEPEEDLGPNRDEFSGLMTRKEKDWVIKIQLMQLQTENPYLDDYYYTSWAMKRLKKERQMAIDEKKGDETKAEPKLVIPHLARVETKGYKPVQFENSLGRVTASSVHNPRQIIDIKRSSSLDHEDAKAREVRRFKELLLEVEKGYDLLLDIDDIEKRALGLPQESRPPLFEARHDRITQVYNLLLSRSRGEGGLYEVLVIRKGIKLVCRVLPLLPKVESQLIVRFFLNDLTAISKKDWQKEVLPSVYRFLVPVINDADLEALVEFTVALLGLSASQENKTNTILSALQNKFGSSVIWAMLGRGAKIYSTESPVDLDLTHQEAWTEFVQLVATALSTLSKDHFIEPLQKFPAVAEHIRQLVDKRSFLIVEDTLQALMGSTQDVS